MRKKPGRKTLSPSERRKRRLAYLKKYNARPDRKARMKKYHKWRNALKALDIIPPIGGLWEADPDTLKQIVPFAEWQEGRPPVHNLPNTRNEFDAPKHDARLDYQPWSFEKPAPSLADTFKPAPQQAKMAIAPAKPAGRTAPKKLIERAPEVKK